jgi:hypothetical protein
MASSEVLITALSCISALLLWALWYRPLLAVRPWGKRVRGIGLLFLAPLIACGVVLSVLVSVASFDVVDDRRYVFMYLALGAAWTGLGALLFGYMGVSVRDDAIERHNAAVPPAILGAWLGLASCYAGGNIGDGPGWWVVAFAGLLATGGLWIVWALAESVTGVADAITIERDVAAGWRLGGLLFGAGLVLGRAVAGDWVSAAGTLQDFGMQVWPALVLLTLYAAFERSLRGTPREPHPPVGSSGIAPALVLVGGAAAYLWWVGLPG